MEAASCRSRAVINAVGIAAAGYVVRASSPVAGISTEVMVVVSVAISVAPPTISVSEERSVIYPPRGIKTPAEWAIENPVTWNESEGVKPGIPIPIGSPPAWVAPSILGVHAGRIDVGFG